MSTVNTTKVECDELTAKSGTGLPDNLKALTPFCYGCIQSNVLINSVNVSSLTTKAEGYTLTMSNSASNANYLILSTRDGNERAISYTISYFNARSPSGLAKTKNQFTLIPKTDTAISTGGGDLSFIVFDKV